MKSFEYFDYCNNLMVVEESDYILNYRQMNIKDYIDKDDYNYIENY